MKIGSDLLITNLSFCLLLFIESKHAIEKTPNETDVKYGDRDGQKLDIFYCNEDDKQNGGKDSMLHFYFH